MNPKLSLSNQKRENLKGEKPVKKPIHKFNLKWLKFSLKKITNSIGNM
jgi:hypothetical protein